MSYQMFDTNNYHTQGAHEIERRIRAREAQRWWLQAAYGSQKDKIHKPVRRGLAALLTNLFGLSL